MTERIIFFSGELRLIHLNCSLLLLVTLLANDSWLHITGFLSVHRRLCTQYAYDYCLHVMKKFLYPSAKNQACLVEEKYQWRGQTRLIFLRCICHKLRNYLYIIPKFKLMSLRLYREKAEFISSN